MKRLWLIALLALVVAVPLQAATIVEYDIASANAGVSNIVNTAIVDPGVTASTMMSQGVTGPFNFAQTFCYISWPTGGALDPTQYYEYTVTPNGGNAVDYQSIDLAVASGGSGTGNFEIHASLDGFGASDILLTTQNFPVNATWQAFNGMDISALGTQAGTVTFRYHMYNIPSSGFAGLGVAPAFGPNGQNYRVNGDVRPSVIPEPSTYLLFGLGALGVLAWRRRQKAAG